MALLSAPVRALAANPKKEAKAHLDQGYAHYQAEAWAQAATAFEAAYDAVPNAAAAYSWGQAERKRGNCRKALELFEEYLDSGPSEQGVEAAKTLIASCEEEVAREDNAAVVPPPPPPGSVPEDARPDGGAGAGPEGPTPAGGPDTTAPERWGRDPTGASLTAIGSVVLAAGAGLLAAGGAQGTAASNAQTYGDFRTQRDRSLVLTVSGSVLGGIGLGLLIGGLVRYGVVARKARSAKKTALRVDGVDLALNGTGAGVSFRAAF